MKYETLLNIVETGLNFLVVGLIILAIFAPLVFSVNNEIKESKEEVVYSNSKAVSIRPRHYINKTWLVHWGDLGVDTEETRQTKIKMNEDELTYSPTTMEAKPTSALLKPTPTPEESEPALTLLTNSTPEAVPTSEPTQFFSAVTPTELVSSLDENIQDQLPEQNGPVAISHEQGSEQFSPQSSLMGSIEMEIKWCSSYFVEIKGPVDFALDSLKTKNGPKASWKEHLSSSIIRKVDYGKTVRVKIGISLNEDEAQIKAQGTINGKSFNRKWRVSCGREAPPFQLAVGLPPNLTGVLVDQADSYRAEEIIRKQEELAGRVGWTDTCNACPINNSRYAPDPRQTSPIELHITGRTETIPGRGDGFQITGIYQRSFGGSLEALGGYDRRDGAAMGGDLFGVYFPEGPSHKFVPDYPAHWALIMGPGGERGSKNLREDFTTEMANPVYVAEVKNAAEVLSRWRMFLGLDHTKKPESCLLAEKGWDGWLIDVKTTREGLIGPYHPMATIERVVFPDLTCNWWGCYYHGWEFSWPADLDHAAISDGQGDLLISDEDRQAIVDIIPWPQLDGEKLIYNSDDIHKFLVVFSRILYQNGLGMYVTQVPSGFEAEVGFSGSGIDFVYLAFLEAEANRLGGFAGKARAGLEEGWNRKHPNNQNRPDLVKAVRDAEAMADEARNWYKQERRRILGE